MKFRVFFFQLKIIDLYIIEDKFEYKVLSRKRIRKWVEVSRDAQKIGGKSDLRSSYVLAFPL